MNVLCLRQVLTLSVLALCACAAESADSTTGSDEVAAAADADAEESQPLQVSPDAGTVRASAGCGSLPTHRSGSAYLSINVPNGGGARRFLVSVPANYDPRRPHRVIFGFSGRDWIGEQMVGYFGFEPVRRADEILVYPDPLRRNFGSWGTIRGWQLGPYGGQAVGSEDIAFVRASVEFLAQNYCIDRERVFATGHSWGGDVTHVLSCFTDLFRATVPVAANDPYWFRAPAGPVTCQGRTAVWTMYGLMDDSFNDAGANGRKVRDFWLKEHRCAGVDRSTDLNIKLPNGKAEQCVAYQGCTADTRLCLYDGQFRHQIPRAYFARETLAYFRSF